MSTAGASQPSRGTRVLLCTQSHDRGSTSRTLEAWAHLLPAHGVTPVLSIGGEGPLFDALHARGIATVVQPIRVWPSFARPLPFLRAVWALVRIIRRERVDLVHVNEHDHHRVPAAAARFAGVPIVTHLRFRPEADYAQWLFRSPYTPRRLFFTSHTQMADTSDALQAVVPRDRWRVIYNGLDIASLVVDPAARGELRHTWGLSDSTIALGVACAISPRKRIDHFVRLIGRLRDAGFDVHGYLAGQPHFPEDEAVVVDLRRLVSELHLEDRFTFLGYVEPSGPLYQAWDIVVSTSEYETFGMTVLEAMSRRCATVVYPGGAVAEVVADAARVVPDGDEEALFDACRELCRNVDLRAELAARGQARARRFDIQEAVTQLAHEYVEVLKERS